MHACTFDINRKFLLYNLFFCVFVLMRVRKILRERKKEIELRNVWRLFSFRCISNIDRSLSFPSHIVPVVFKWSLTTLSVHLMSIADEIPIYFSLLFEQFTPFDIRCIQCTYAIVNVQWHSLKYHPKMDRYKCASDSDCHSNSIYEILNAVCCCCCYHYIVCHFVFISSVECTFEVYRKSNTTFLVDSRCRSHHWHRCTSPMSSLLQIFIAL